MEKKSAEPGATQAPLIDSRKVLAAALEKDSPGYWDFTKITGLIYKTVDGEKIPKFTTLIIDGDKQIQGEVFAFPDDLQRYEDELAELEKTS